MLDIVAEYEYNYRPNRTWNDKQRRQRTQPPHGPVRCGRRCQRSRSTIPIRGLESLLRTSTPRIPMAQTLARARIRLVHVLRSLRRALGPPGLRAPERNAHISPPASSSVVDAGPPGWTFHRVVPHCRHHPTHGCLSVARSQGGRPDQGQGQGGPARAGATAESHDHVVSRMPPPEAQM